MKSQRSPHEYRDAIRESYSDIYSPIEVGDEDCWIPTDVIEILLNEKLVGTSLEGLPIRTRSKRVKSAVCDALGYAVPKSFRKTQPRFVGQQLDVYTQKSNNLQIWNEELSPNRRYAIVRVDSNDVICKIKVVNGQELALLDTTGTITKKYQAQIIVSDQISELVTPDDTCAISAFTNSQAVISTDTSPTDEPSDYGLLPIQSIFEKLTQLIGKEFPDPGTDQERNRGAELHKLVSDALGYKLYGDNGKFPDIRNQLLEIKLQTSPTIDLGLILPTSTENLDVTPLGNIHPQHCDTRYAVFYATTDGEMVKLTHLIVVTGQSFFRRFRQFQGNTINGKIQIPLPASFFD